MGEINEIIIDDGKKKYDIKNQDGEVIGSFRLNPLDLDLRKRYLKVVDSFSNMNNQISDDEDIDKIIDTLEEESAKQIDYLFGSPVSKEFFSITSPFSIMANGDFFLVNVINVIGSLIEKETGERVKKVQKKIGKYTQKYHG